MIIVSACLLGCNCRYDGANNYIEALDKLVNNNMVISMCPEQEGGLPTPRTPCEKIRGGNIIITKNKEDKTLEFTRGAQICLEKIDIKNIDLAILKARSPSCGFGEIYNGLFEGKLIPGNGIFADLLNKNGIEIFNENNFHESGIISSLIHK